MFFKIYYFRTSGFCNLTWPIEDFSAELDHYLEIPCISKRGVKRM